MEEQNKKYPVYTITAPDKKVLKHKNINQLGG